MISGSLKGDVVVTTINAAAAWRVQRFVSLTGIAVLFAMLLAGCSTTPDIFGGGGLTAQNQETAPATAQQAAATIALAPVIGAPDHVAKQLQAQLTSSLQAQNIAVASGPTVPYTMRGYVVSAREGAGTKVSYIWDVTDTTGKRVHRISGEEIAPAAGADPWAAVTPDIMGRISNQTAQSLKSWLPAPNPVAGAAAVAGAVQRAPQSALAAGQRTAAAAGAAAQQQVAAAAGAITPSGPTTGSIGNSGYNAIVPSVTGAPGDGSVSLTRAIRKELSRSGVALANSPNQQSYKVEGRVALRNAAAGKQEIAIDWDVKDPSGKKLGTVSQKNQIPAGSLNGEWGRTADAAAAAAAQGIVKLLPQRTAAAN